MSHERLHDRNEAAELSCATADDFDLTESDLQAGDLGVGIGADRNDARGTGSDDDDDDPIEPMYNSYGR